MRSYISQRMSDDLPYSVLCHISFFNIDIGISELARLVRVAFFAPHWGWLFLYIVDVAMFALCDFAVRCLKFGLNICSLAFDGVSIFSRTGVSVVKRCGHWPFELRWVQYSIPVNGLNILLNANSAIWSICPRQQLVDRFILRF